MNDTIINFSSFFFNFTNPNGTQPTITTISLNMHDIISQICTNYNNWTIGAIITIIIVNSLYIILLKKKYRKYRRQLFMYEPQEILVFNITTLIFILITMVF